MTGKIFINYRRGDDPGNTGRLFDRLQDVFEPEQLFLDVDNIAPGLDFVRELNDRVAECDIVLAVIGKGWMEARDAAGARRLDDPDDFVRIEIVSALNQGKRVIPVLVGEAQMPRPEDLPEALQPLSRRNAVRLTHERFRADMAGLVKALQQSLEEFEGQRQAEAEIARRAQAEEERKRREAEATRLADEERRRQETEAARRVEEEELRRKTQIEAQERAVAERRRQETEAKQRVAEDRAFAEAKRAGTVLAFDTFLNIYPTSASADEAGRLKAALLAREEAYRRTASSHDPAVLRSFLATYKKGADVDQVSVRLRILEPQQGWHPLKPAIVIPGALVVVLLVGAALFWAESKSPISSQQVTLPARPAAQSAANPPETAIAPVQKPDEVAWTLLNDTTDEAALKRFIAQFPNSSLRKQAEARITALAAAAAAKAQAAQQAEAAAKLAAANQTLAAERAKLAAQAQPSSDQQVALATPQDSSRTTPVPPSGSALIQQIKMELMRVGCYAGQLDDDWKSSSVKLAITKFVKAASLSKTPEQPTTDFLNAVRNHSSRVCPLECGRTETEANGKCIAKTCLNGQKLDRDGDCENVKERTASRPPPASSAAPQPARPSAAASAGGAVGVSCGRFGCKEHVARPAPSGLPCKQAWQDRMGNWHCT